MRMRTRGQIIPAPGDFTLWAPEAASGIMPDRVAAAVFAC